MKAVVLTDLHDAPRAPAGDRAAGALGDLLLLRAVHRINRWIRPDAVLLLGDLLDDPAAPDADALLARLRAALDLLRCPWIALPGNHDPAPDCFYRRLPDPGPWQDIAGCRFVCFPDDRAAPGYNAAREQAGLERLAAARAGYPGPLVALQHISLHPPGSTSCPYNLLNAAAVLNGMARLGVRLSLGGHYHPGIPLIETGGPAILGAPALVDPPFPFLELQIETDRIEVERHVLGMPPALELTDTHVHTAFAYCNENMDVARAVDLAARTGLAGLAFAEHASHLYLTREQIAAGAHVNPAVRLPPRAGAPRLQSYFNAAGAAPAPFARAGLEIDCAWDGIPYVAAADRTRCQIQVGAVHRLRELEGPDPDLERAADAFLGLLARFLPCGLDILAHPFRVFRRLKQPCPPRLFPPVCRLLKQHGVAAELNFHTNQPPPAFVQQCIEQGVPLAFGSDAHNLYEVGEFAPHLALLRGLGCDGDIRPLLFRSPPAA